MAGGKPSLSPNINHQEAHLNKPDITMLQYVRYHSLTTILLNRSKGQSKTSNINTLQVCLER